MKYLLLAMLAVCSPFLFAAGVNAGTVVGDAVADIIQSEKHLESGQAVRVSFSALRKVGIATDIVTSFTSGQSAIPDSGEAQVIDFNHSGLKVDIRVVRDYRGQPMIVFYGEGSVFDTACVLKSKSGCNKSVSLYPAREQLLLVHGVNEIRLGDYRLTVNVEGPVARS